jgi:hypothetical protein
MRKSFIIGAALAAFAIIAAVTYIARPQPKTCDDFLNATLSACDMAKGTPK